MTLIIAEEVDIFVTRVILAFYLVFIVTVVAQSSVPYICYIF